MEKGIRVCPKHNRHLTKPNWSRSEGSRRNVSKRMKLIEDFMCFTYIERRFTQLRESWELKKW